MRRFIEAGGKVTIADVYPPAIEKLTQRFPDVNVVSCEDIYDVKADVFAPCSLGGVLTEETIPRLKLPSDRGFGQQPTGRKRGCRTDRRAHILYAPDFVVNAGGLINVSEELRGYTVDRAVGRIDKIYDNTMRVLEGRVNAGSRQTGLPSISHNQRIEEIGNLRLFRAAATTETKETRVAIGIDPVHNHLSLGISDDSLLHMYRTMVLGRRADDRMWALNRQGRAPFVVSSSGHEAAQVGTALALDRRHDWALALLPRCCRGTRPGDDRRGDLPRRVLQGWRSQQRRAPDAQPLVAPPGCGSSATHR